MGENVIFMSRLKIYLTVGAFILAFIGTLSATETPASRNPTYEAYIALWRATALAQQAEHGIPASITLAQGLLESGAGQSDLATIANNHFGIKCHSDWQGNTYNKDDDRSDECFRSYSKAEDSFRDHSLFLKRKRYEKLFTYNISDYKAWAQGLRECGYATDPRYPQKLIQIIETYELDKISKAKPEKQEKVEKPGKQEKTEKADKQEKATKHDKPAKTEKTESSAQTAKHGRHNKPGASAPAPVPLPTPTPDIVPDVVPAVVPDVVPDIVPDVTPAPAAAPDKHTKATAHNKSSKTTAEKPAKATTEKPAKATTAEKAAKTTTEQPTKTAAPEKTAEAVTPEETAKTATPEKPAEVPVADTDTVEWTPSQLRSSSPYAAHAYGRMNGRKFIVAQEGDSWGAIAFTAGMEEKTLRRINEASATQTLRGGDKVYFLPKRAKADRKHTHHRVQRGETAWDVAQYYGMRLSNLNKLNGLQEGAELRVGQVLKLR